MLPTDLPGDLPSFLERFGTDEQCRAYLFGARWPDGFRCAGYGHERAWAHKARLIYECAACGKQHSLLAGTIFEQTKTGLARWFLAIFLVTSSKGGISAMELQRQMGFGSCQTAWTWLHKIRKAMVRPDREPLVAWVEADETYVGGPRPNRPGRGAAGKTRVAGAVESGRGKTRGRRLVRLRLAVVPDVSARSLEGFLATAGYRHEPVNLTASWGDAALRLPAIHSVFGLAAIVEAAAAASASEYRADYAFHNVVSLQPLVEQHGVELRLFPDDVVEALGRTSREVIAELGARTPLTRRIHDSYMGFLERANVYGQWFELPMLRMRAAALGRV